MQRVLEEAGVSAAHPAASRLETMEKERQEKEHARQAKLEEKKEEALEDKKAAQEAIHLATERAKSITKNLEPKVAGERAEKVVKKLEKISKDINVKDVEDSLAERAKKPG